MHVLQRFYHQKQEKAIPSLFWHKLNPGRNLSWVLIQNASCCTIACSEYGFERAASGSEDLRTGQRWQARARGLARPDPDQGPVANT